MDTIRRAIATFSIVAILSSLIVSTAAASFSDVDSIDWFESHVEALAAESAIDDTMETFSPGDDLLRGEALKWLLIMSGRTVTTATTADFPDVPLDHELADYIYSGVSMGIVGGYDDETFGPDDPITREQYTKMVVLAYDFPLVTTTTSSFPDADDINDWAVVYVETASQYGAMVDGEFEAIVEGYDDGTFGPGENINRAAGAKMTVVAIGSEMEPADTDDDTDDDDDEPAGGDLEVEVSDDTAVGATLPSGATSVEMATWDFTAGDEDVTIESLTIHRYGVSDLPSGHSVYVYNDLERLTSGKSVNSTTNESVFNNLNVDVESGETVSLTLRMDVGTVSNTGELGFELVDADAVDIDGGDVEGDFPLEGDKFGTSATAAGSVTITKNGTVTDVAIGEDGATIAKFKMEAATENASVEEVGLYVGGTINTADIANFKLYAAGETDPVAEVDAVNAKDIAHFVLDDPYLIDKGDTRSFWMTADFDTGRTDDTVLVYIDESTDVVAIGGTYEYGMTVTYGGYDGTDSGTACSTSAKDECSALTLEGGDITISGATIATRNIAVNQNDIAILNFSITSQSDVTFDNFAMHLDMSADSDATAGLLSDAAGTPANITDIKISEVDGPHIWGPIDADALLQSIGGDVITEGTDAADAFYLFTDDLDMEAGETKEFALTIDVANEAALADATITASIDIDSTYPTLKDANNKTLTNTTSLVPTSDYDGDAFTITSDSLTVVRSSSVGSKTVVVGADDESLLALSMGAGDASDLKVTSVKFTGYIDDNGTTNLFEAGSDTVVFNEVVLGMNLYEGSVAEENMINGTAKAAASNGEVTFDNLDWTIDAGETVTLIVAGNLSNNSSYNTDQLKVDIADVDTDITAENEDGNSVTSSSSDGPNGTTTDSSSLYTQITVSSGGTLSVDIPSNTPPSEIVVAGTTGNEFSKIKFTATEEAFLVDKVALKNTYSSTAGDYDDNIDSIRVKYYTDEAQTEAGSTDCAAGATAGFFVCTGMDMMVPDPGTSGAPDYALMTIEVDLNDVADSLADEGDYPELTFALAYDFEANGVSSGKKIEESGTNDISITDVSGAGTDSTLDGEEASIGATDTTIVADGAVGSNLAVGDIFCIDVDDAASSCASLEHIYVSGISGTDLTVVRGVNGTDAAAYTAAGGNDSFLKYSSLLSANFMQLQATDLGLAADSTRAGDTAGTEAILTFTATANAAKDAQVRQGYYEGCTSDSTADVNGGTGPTSSNASAVSGNGLVLTVGAGPVAVTDGGGEFYQFSSGDAGDYSRVSFWVKWHDEGGATALPVDDVKFATDDDGDGTAGLQSSNLGSTPLTEDIWYFFDMAVPTGTATGDDYFGLYFNDGVTLVDATAANAITLDEVIFYNEKINVDLKLNEDWAAVTPTVAYLKQNTKTVATAMVDLDTIVSSRTGQIQFVPVSTYANIDISGEDTFVVEMDTATAVTDDSDAVEKLTATIDLGFAGTTAGSSTAGDVYWYDGSSILDFLGINSTDKISTVTSY